MDNNLSELRSRLRELFHLRSALALASWDEEVYMPERGAPLRAEMLAYLSGLHHRKLLNLNHDGLLDELNEARIQNDLSKKESALVREVMRDFTLASKIPASFVEEFAEAASLSQRAWAQARAKSDFGQFKPHLQKMVDLSRRKASLLGATDKPYDALLDTYEPGATAEELSITFEELKAGLIPLLQRVKKSEVKMPKPARGTFPKTQQEAFLALINEKLGFDRAGGRLDVSTHPFTNGIHPLDVRITTRYDEKNPWYAIGSDIHELGHALYEQGLPEAETGTPLGESVSLGVHESQSRFWENMVGKNINTWRHLYPLLKKQFPALKAVSLEDFHGAISAVRPSLIRTEADEVTYNLHIIIRFELEKGLIEGTIAVADLPDVWRQKMRDYLGLEVKHDAEGVLQDVHW